MRDLTLILASTPKMGIGLSNALPWPTTLKKEMAYFARVTKRAPSPSVQNAVVMGRKTWDSIPPRFRPLPDRINIVISRSISTIEKKEDKAIWAGSLEKALQWVDTEGEGQVGRVFVIGGAEIYKAALGLKEARRVLLTRVEREWECDVFFPIKLEEDGEGGWKRVGQEQMDEWVGEEVPRGRQVEKEGTEEETGYEFEMWERVD